MKKHTALLAALALSGCSPHPAVAPTPNKMDASLAEASYNVSRALSSLSETAQAAHPLRELPPPRDPASYGMAGLTSVDWSGPVEPLVHEMAKATRYHLRVLGGKPAIPVMVSVYNQNTAIADILRDVGYQCGRRATIAVYPEERVIELRYARA